MVRRLVEEQQVGIGEQQPGQRDPHHPAAGELADVALGVGIGKAQPGEDAASLSLDRPAAELLEPMLEAAVFVHQLGQLGLGLIGLGRSELGHLLLDVAHPPTDAGHRPGPGQDLGQDGMAARLGDFLLAGSR